MGQEYEHKFRGDGQVLSALEAAFPGPWETVQMETIYYDSGDGSLSRQHITLRCRMENHTAVCTMKTPAGALTRGEYQIPESRIETAFPELCKLAGREDLLPLAQFGLIPVCGAKFVRKLCHICNAGSELELALDQGALLGNGNTAPLCEVEVELISGEKADADRFAEELVRKFGLVPEEKSKFRRALDLSKEAG